MNDAAFMARALHLAAGAEGRVSPRPPVGAVVVDREGAVAGEGATQPDPGPHAEVVALDQAGARARGATVYVSFEPCSHTGSTGPCAEALVRAGVARVVAAMRDPNPVVAGRGLRRLRSAGVEVKTGVLRERARELVAPFAAWVSRGRPLVTVKLAASLDGKVAAADGSSRWITGEAARRQVHELRARCDAVLVGAGTVAADDPSLTARIDADDRPQPVRVVCDSSGRTPPTARIFDDRAPTLVLTTQDAPEEARTRWSCAGAEVVVVPRHEAGVDLDAGLRALADRGVCHVLAEGGPHMSAELMRARLVDRVVLYIAPKLIGGDAPGVLADGGKTLADAWQLAITSVRRVGDDIRIDARPGAA